MRINSENISKWIFYTNHFIWFFCWIIFSDRHTLFTTILLNYLVKGGIKMGKVLFLNYPEEGHVNPTIALVEELIKKGEEVVYYCIEEYRNKIEKTGATFRPYKNFTRDADLVKKWQKEWTLLKCYYIWYGLRIQS